MQEINTDISVAVNNLSALKPKKNCFSGEFNKDITPEFLIRLTKALADTLPPCAKILLSIADKTEYLAIKFALLSGIIAAGAEAYNIVDAGDRNVAKFTLRKFSLDAGIHVEVNGKDISLELLNHNGVPVGDSIMNTIQEKLKTDQYRHIEPSQFLPPVNANKMPLYYFKNLVSTTCCKRLKFTGVICTSSQETQRMLKKISTAFGLSLIFTNDEESLPQFITDNRADFGLLIGKNGKCGLFDEHGRVLNGDTYYGLVTLIVLSAVSNGTVLMPVHASGIVEEIAEVCGGTIVRVADNTLEQNLIDSETPASRLQYELCFDAIHGMIRICEFLYFNQCRLSYVCNLLPVMYKINRHVDCSADKKTEVMHKILSSLGSDSAVDITEGIKIVNGRGWVLIIPDEAGDKINIVSESHNAEVANEIASEICDAISKFSKEN